MEVLERREMLLRARITDTPLPNRAKRCLLRAQVVTVGQLVQRTEDDLLAMRNFAETSLAAVKRYLERHGLTLAPERQSRCRTEWVVDALSDGQFELAERDRSILTSRHGLNGEGTLTLDQVGKRLGLTRERVRQLQKAAEHRIACRALFLKQGDGRMSGGGDGLRTGSGG